jgi:predicted protein tyrosine phosphatase
MQIKITDMYEAREIANDYDFVISVFDPNKRAIFRLDHNKHFVAKFWDTEHPNEMEWSEMSSEVRSILSWVKNQDIKDETKVLVHCHAGVSRSSALAWLILIQSGVEWTQAFQSLFKNRSQIWPNKVVMSLGAEFLNLDPAFMKLVSGIDAEIAINHREYLGYGG